MNMKKYRTTLELTLKFLRFREKFTILGKGIANRFNIVQPLRNIGFTAILAAITLLNSSSSYIHPEFKVDVVVIDTGPILLQAVVEHLAGVGDGADHVDQIIGLARVHARVREIGLRQVRGKAVQRLAALEYQIHRQGRRRILAEAPERRPRNVEFADLLLRHGAELDAFSAAALGRTDQLAVLIDRGEADLGARSPDGWTARSMPWVARWAEPQT